MLGVSLHKCAGTVYHLSRRGRPEAVRGGNGGLDMNEDVLSAPPAATALPQPRDRDDDQNPEPEGQGHRDQQTHVEPRGSSRLHRAASLVLVVGTCVIQVAWIALLAYGTYWIGSQIPG